MIIATTASNAPESHGKSSSRVGHLSAGVPGSGREVERDRLAT